MPISWRWSTRQHIKLKLPHRPANDGLSVVPANLQRNQIHPGAHGQIGKHTPDIWLLGDIQRWAVALNQHPCVILTCLK